jgi:hypothetical protein
MRARVIVLVLALGARLAAQQAEPTPRTLAPIDLTGYWVSIVNEDWRWRMLTPPKGDFASIPLNPEGRRVTQAWDYEREQAAENACKPFGIGGLSRMPGRLRITWQDDRTLKVEFDAGTQTRRLHFGAAPASPQPTWQGDSTAAWEFAGGVETDRNGIPVASAAGRGARPRADAPKGGSLRVTTANVLPGFLRKNGVPYSDKARIEEYFDRITYPNGDTILLVRTVVDDAVYLQLPFITSTHFKLERDGSKWKPTPCRIDPPVVRPEPTRP